MSDRAEEETRDPFYADDRNFHKVEKWAHVPYSDADESSSLEA
jgi:hypothetical protein